MNKVLFNVSIKKWNSVFGNRGRYPFTKVRVFLSADSAEIHFVNTLIAKVFVLGFFPFFYIYGIIHAGHIESWEAIMDILFQESRKSFSKEISLRGERNWDKLLELLV